MKEIETSSPRYVGGDIDNDDGVVPFAQATLANDDYDMIVTSSYHAVGVASPEPVVVTIDGETLEGHGHPQDQGQELHLYHEHHFQYHQWQEQQRPQQPPPLHQDAPEHARMVSAGTAIGVLGLFCGGPVLALVLGLSAAYATQRDDSAIGDISRAVGDVALLIQEKAIQVNRQHHLLDKTKEAATECLESFTSTMSMSATRTTKIRATTASTSSTMSSTSNSDRKKGWKVFRKVIVTSWTWTVDFTRKHHLIERGVGAVGHGMDRLTEKLATKLEHDQQQPRHVSDNPAATSSSPSTVRTGRHQTGKRI